jgi:hypothetical protein
MEMKTEMVGENVGRKQKFSWGENRKVWGKQTCLWKAEMLGENRNVWGKLKCWEKTERFGKNRNV